MAKRTKMKGLIPSPQTPLQVMHKAEKKYEVGKVADEEEAKQRQLNKLMPLNFEKLFEQVKAVNIDNAVTLAGFVLQIFDKALMEPTFCEMYVNMLLYLAVELPDFNENDEKITFRRLLLNKCQEEFERGVTEPKEANKADEEGVIKPSEEEREEKRIKARRRMLGNIRLIGELYKRKMLTERVVHECIKRLLGEYQNPDEEDIEALCKLMSTIGEMIDHPKAKVHMDAYFDRMAKLSDNSKLSSRVRFMLKDTIDMRKNKWQQRRKVEGPKKIEEVHWDAAQERQQQSSRLARNPGMNISARRTPMDFGPRGSSMLPPHNSSIEVKAMVDKEKNQIMFVESNADFVDVLLGFLTMPMGSIIRLIHPPTIGTGCMNNLYRSAESLDEKNFRTPQCKSMLLQPQNGAEAQFNSLKVKIHAYQPCWYICSTGYCAISKHKLLSRYGGASCACGGEMNCEMIPEEGVPKDKAHAEDESVFIKGMARHLITDDLQIIPLSTASTFSLLSRIGVANASAIEERTFDMRVNEVVNLLAWSLVSKVPLTETLLKSKAEPKLIKEELFHGTGYHSEVGKSGDGTVCVRLIVSKSKKLVCYADVSNDFVDLLFGFLTVPLGYIFKEMRGAPSKGCAFNLYKSVEDLDAGKYWKSEEHKNMLLYPKVAPLFGFEKQLLNVEEALNKKYYYYKSLVSSIYTRLVTAKSLVSSGNGEISELTVMDPKSPFKKATKGGGGFVTAHTMFTVTDDLIITPLSPFMCLSILNKMQVPPEDVEEFVVPVGKKEASELLIASFTSETPLTDVFLRKKTNTERVGQDQTLAMKNFSCITMPIWLCYLCVKKMFLSY